ncbi:glutamate receptor U1-like [Mytilus galloprovincialis]|uniref:glutamate receptor U1-like n=1 Tax=Mytilus galloprovincialis TaxID=29158 RepID=UPI003F7C9F36
MATTGEALFHGCQPPSWSLIYPNKIDSATLTLISVITHLKWTSVCVIFDKSTELEALEFHHRLSVAGRYAVMYRMEDMTSSKIDDIISTYSQSSIMLNFTVFCRLDSCQSFLKQPFKFDRTNILRNSLLHFSRWLVNIFDDKNLMILEDDHIPFDNVAVIQYSSSQLKLFENSHTIKKQEKSCTHTACKWFPMYTLMWHRDQRGLSDIKINGSVLTDKDIFPNARFSFNNRKFLVSTIPSYPFVMFDNTTKTYTGITMKLLKHLSEGLNFTYDLIGPPDGNWGAELDNGYWNGMVGQLQRKEVDMVATALTVQSQREMVMDFTHPYYYEFSSILVKKSDPSETRWTKLLDPFSSTVFLFVGISVPACSFLIFFFEKYNPFYGKVIQRRKTRGLHHFSDSFYYMYGALLTHGGKHVPASSSGRTFLSCWWIFCIIIVATYTSNFVAFLTITKETLPFEGIQGLVGQNVFKWGTIGGSVYETIFKNSVLAERRSFWNGIVRSNITDPNVLSSDYDEQILKVLEGEYAFVWDNIPMEISVAKSCELSIISTDIFSTYALGLPNNSPFQKVFSDGIMAVLEGGLIDLWMSKIWPKLHSCHELLLTRAKPITIFDVQIALYLIGVGICLALLSLLTECFKRRCQRWLKKRSRSRQEGETLANVNQNEIISNTENTESQSI